MECIKLFEVTERNCINTNAMIDELYTYMLYAISVSLVCRQGKVQALTRLRLFEDQHITSRTRQVESWIFPMLTVL